MGKSNQHGLLLALFLTMGCSSVHQAEDTKSGQDTSLKQQVLELQKLQAKQSAEIEDLNNKLLILKDQIGKGEDSPKPIQPVAPPHAGSINNDKVGIPPSEDAVAGPIPEVQVRPLAPQAAPAFEEKQHPKGLNQDEKLYRQVVLASKKNDSVNATKILNTMIKQFRDSPLTNNALYFYADSLFERRNYTKSAEQFEKLYKLYPDGNKAVSALYKLALCYQKLGHPTEAQEAFENIVTVYPGSREALESEKQIMNGPKEDVK